MGVSILNWNFHQTLLLLARQSIHSQYAHSHHYQSISINCDCSHTSHALTAILLNTKVPHFFYYIWKHFSHMSTAIFIYWVCFVLGYLSLGFLVLLLLLFCSFTCTTQDYLSDMQRSALPFYGGKEKMHGVMNICACRYEEDLFSDTWHEAMQS